RVGFVYGERDGERGGVLKGICRKARVEIALPSFAALIPEKGKHLSGADIEAMLVRARFKALAEGREKVTADDIKNVITDFVPPSYPLEIELQNLAAVQECTSRELLPENFRTMDRDLITSRIRELKTMLEER